MLWVVYFTRIWVHKNITTTPFPNTTVTQPWEMMPIESQGCEFFLWPRCADNDDSIIVLKKFMKWMLEHLKANRAKRTGPWVCLWRKYLVKAQTCSKDIWRDKVTLYMTAVHRSLAQWDMCQILDLSFKTPGIHYTEDFRILTKWFKYPTLLKFFSSTFHVTVRDKGCYVILSINK